MGSEMCIRDRVYPSKHLLKERLKQLSEAKLRDHRIIGKDMKLFHIDETVGQGLILWTPRGASIRQELQNFITSSQISFALSASSLVKI